MQAPERRLRRFFSLLTAAERGKLLLLPYSMSTPSAAAVLLALLGILFVLLPLGFCDPYPASEADMNALLELKKTIWDDPHNALESWRPAKHTNGYGHPCNFSGIECDANYWRVRSIFLENKGLKGILSEIVGNLTIMLRLNISNNYFMGPLPRGFKDMVQLRVVDLSNNLFSGKIPVDMGHMKDLQEFYVANNMLSGPLLTFVNLTTCRGNTRRRCFTPNQRLVTIDLSQNSLTGRISPNYGTSLPNLINLKLSYNRILGRIPPELGLSGTLETFDVTQNMLTGPIPWQLVSLKLRWFSVVNNSLSGPVPITATTLEYAPWGFLPGNPLLCGPIVGVDCPGKVEVWRKYVAQAFTIALPTIAGILFLRWLFPPDPYSVSRVREMTEHFMHARVVGEGTTCVIYRGTLRTGETVAVKRFRETYIKEKSRSRLYKMERKRLPYVIHPNIAKVFGGCTSKRIKCLVMEMFPNGTLEMHLPKLSWLSRLDIAAGVAQGLAYLHGECQGPPAFHCDLKPSSILLDDEFHAHLTDIRLENGEIIAYTDPTFVRATGYMAPEISLIANYTPASEVYGFGTLMLHLLTGKEPWLAVKDDGLQGVVRQAYPDNLESVVDPHFSGEPSKTDLGIYTSIALRCSRTVPAQRPEMYEVLDWFKELYPTESRRPTKHIGLFSRIAKFCFKGKEAAHPQRPETVPPLTVNPFSVMLATSDPEILPPAADMAGATTSTPPTSELREPAAASSTVASKIRYCFK